MKVEVGLGYLLTKWLNMYLKLKKGNGLYMCYHVTWNCYNADDSFLFNFNHLMCYNFVKKRFILHPTLALLPVILIP